MITAKEAKERALSSLRDSINEAIDSAVKRGALTCFYSCNASKSLVELIRVELLQAGYEVNVSVGRNISLFIGWSK